MGLGLEAGLALAPDHRGRPHGRGNPPHPRQRPQLHRGRLQNQRQQRHRGQHRRARPLRRRLPPLRREHVPPPGSRLGHDSARLLDPGHVARSCTFLPIWRQGKAVESVRAGVKDFAFRCRNGGSWSWTLGLFFYGGEEG